MKLLFNDLGADPNQRPIGAIPVDGSLEHLRNWFLPKGAGGSGSVIGGDRPPTLLVILTTEAFRCCLTDMSVTRKAIHPITRATVRAEVSVVFTQFTPGNLR